MSWIGDAFGGLKQILLLDGDVRRLSTSVDTMQKQIVDQDRRLLRIETIIEFSRPAAPPQPRLPR